MRTLHVCESVFQTALWMYGQDFRGTNLCTTHSLTTTQTMISRDIGGAQVKINHPYATSTPPCLSNDAE